MDWLRHGRAASIFAAVIGLMCLMGSILGCRQKVQERVTISFVDPEWSTDTQKPRNTIMQKELDEFTRQTGIRVKHLPSPESTQDQMELVRQLIPRGAEAPDVYGIDMIWPGVLGEGLADLKGALSEEMKGKILRWWQTTW